MTDGPYSYSTRRGRRPKLRLDWQTISWLGFLAEHQWTQAECAAFFRVSRATFVRFLADHEVARNAWDDGQQVGLAKLRFAMFEMAEAGSVPMLIHLGEAYLGQHPKLKLELVDTETMIAACAAAFDTELARFLDRRKTHRKPTE